MTIDSDVKITINISELVNIRSVFLQEEISLEEIEEIANDLRIRLTWDTLYGMVDDAILEYLDKADKHYGETAGDEPAKSFEAERKAREKYVKENFEMITLSSPSWEIEVPRRIK